MILSVPRTGTLVIWASLVRRRAAAQAIDILQRVASGALPFDRTMKILTYEHMAKQAPAKFQPASPVEPGPA